MIKPPPDFRKDITPYRVFFTWDITYKCNYKCTYCAFGGAPNAYEPYPTVYLEISKWLKIWEEIYNRYGSCEIHFAGGEPFIYPNFMNLIENLSIIHTMEFSTNLFWEPEEFIKRIKPECARIGVSFHPEFVTFDVFFDKVNKLKNAGFEIWVNYVGYPSIFEGIEEYKRKFEEIEVFMNVLPFKGEYNGRKYPEGYTEEEKKQLEKVCNYSWTKKSMDFSLNKKERQSKNNLRLCRMGQMYAKIYPNGDVFRCCIEGANKLGNLIEGTFSLFEEPKECNNIDKCPCWKSMLVGKEDFWGPHWVVPKAARFFGNKYYK